MDTPAEAVPALFDQAGVIIADTACRRCGYNLRGLHRDGRCPECGTPIGLSTHGDLLRFADPDWVEKLALGMKYIVWGIVIFILMIAMGVGLLACLRVPKVLLQAAAVPAGLIHLYGAWLLTTPDPSSLHEDRYVTARKIVRFALLIGLLDGALQVAVQAAPNMPTPLFVGLVVVGASAAVIGAVGEFAKFSYLAMLADRIPDAKSAKRARFLRYALAIGIAVAAIGGIATNLVGGPGAAGPGFAGPAAGTPGGPGSATSAPAATSGPAPGAAPGGLPAAAGPAIASLCVTSVAGVALLVFGVMAFFLFIRTGKLFREQAGIARQTWAVAVVQATPITPASPPPASP